MGDEADRLNDMDDFSYLFAEQERDRFDDERRKMADRFSDNARAEVGATIECASCSRKIVKRSYQQKFCPSARKGKRSRCLDRYHNVMNPRGKFAHLAEI